MSEQKLHTNLAAEYHVLSMLHRFGANALMTVGNKKAVDIVVENGGKTFTVEVKGLSKGYSFPAGNYRTKINDKNHYFVFVSFRGQMRSADAVPDVYIVPAKDLEKNHAELGNKLLIIQNKVNNVYTTSLELLSAKYKNKWEVFQ